MIMVLAHRLASSLFCRLCRTKPPHNHLRQQIFRPRHDRATAEEQARIVEFQQVGFLAEPGSVVDARAVLHEGGVAARIFGGAGIDRYLVEGAASAAQGF